MLFLHQWIPEIVIKAFCWTLIHSLWQGFAAALIAGCVILSTKRVRASLRYNLLTLTLLAFLVTSVVTFFMQLSKIPGGNNEITKVKSANYAIQLALQEKQVVAIQNSGQQNQNLILRFTDYFNDHAVLIVFIWFLFFLVKSVQLFAGLHYIHKIRYRRNEAVPDEWRTRLFRLCQETGVHQSILFLQSELVKLPVVIGLLKPVILVPVGVFTHLSVQQVEAILIHELAHIRRKDFLVNLLQSFTEAIYFFNPAILWISSLVREEREACCDDLVVSIMPHKKSYLEALVSFQSHSFTHAGHAMALGGKRNYLLHRVQRMLTQENKKLNVMEKTILILGLIGIAAFSFIPANEKAIKPLKDSLPQAISVTKTELPVAAVNKEYAIRNLSPLPLHIVRKDTVPKSKVKIKEEKEGLSFPNLSSSTKDDGQTRTTSIEATDNTGKKYSVKKLNDEITELTVDGVVVPKERYDEYSGSLQRINEILLSRSLRSARAGFDDETKRRIELDQKLRARENDREFERALMGEKREMQRKQQMWEMQELKTKRRTDLNRKLELNRMERSKFRTEDSARRFKKFNGYRPTINMKSREEITSIVAELKNNKLIDDTEDLSFTLNSKELIVNGKKQPAAMHQQFKEKYINKPGDYFIYKRNGNSTSTSINKE
jgi:bla regulator protein BlaR1